MIKKIKRTGFVQYLARKYRGHKKMIINGKRNKIINHGKFGGVKFDIEGDDNRIEIAKGAVLDGVKVLIRGNNHTVILDENCAYKNGQIWMEGSGCRIKLGKNTSIESAFLAALKTDKSIEIGDNCLISYNVEIRTGDSHSIIDSGSKERINPDRNIVIGNHVWIGSHVSVLKGVHIADNAVIGTYSLVTKDVPPNSVVGGSPAKVLKENINWLHEQI
ncbi:MAG: acyltransferase [Candidatus Azobacteroides sp.]|nr:acyltransferase [Candidatus Azobacteroides sp.]